MMALSTGLWLPGKGYFVAVNASDCDDGNIMGGDGCDATCKRELPAGVCARR